MTALLLGADRAAQPRLVRHYNVGSLWNLPNRSTAPKGDGEQFRALKEKGVEAIQHPFPWRLQETSLDQVGMGRIDKPENALKIARAHKNLGLIASTLHVGTGLEKDHDADVLVAAIIDASVTENYPLFVETHRATVTQDIRRTLDLVDRFPDIRFNADLSHWYTGHEMTYGDINMKFDALEPIFERTRYIHGRIGTPCNVQVAIEGPSDTRPFVDHFREMWRRCLNGFIKTATNGEVLPFAPELLPYSVDIGGQSHLIYYAQQTSVAGDMVEESDRWEQADFLFELIERQASNLV